MPKAVSVCILPTFLFDGHWHRYLYRLTLLTRSSKVSLTAWPSKWQTNGSLVKGTQKSTVCRTLKAVPGLHNVYAKQVAKAHKLATDSALSLSLCHTHTHTHTHIHTHTHTHTHTHMHTALHSKAKIVCYTEQNTRSKICSTHRALSLSVCVSFKLMHHHRPPPPLPLPSPPR